MKVFTVDLEKEYGTQGGELDCLLADEPYDGNDESWARPAVIVVPGGAYAHVSKREGEPIAFEFLSLGFHAFVLRYVVGGENGLPYPEQLIELGASVDYLKKHAKELRVNPDEIFVVGFSAGGHLTGDLAVEYASVSEKAGKTLDCKPAGVGLCYPVITERGHKGSFDNLLYGYSDEAKTELLKTLELHKGVTEDTPPAFLWAMAKDDAVKVQDNVLLYAQACAEKNVDFELHIYPEGFHGSSTGRAEINAGNPSCLKRTLPWTDDCASFFRLYCKEEF
ncbi:MAG: alpha/beta hydrolase [Clostridia bacterium]|nr:alpha/beta hydrolase [Clostridia bacterium]